jgi:hypothetical protein
MPYVSEGYRSVKRDKLNKKLDKFLIVFRNNVSANLVQNRVHSGYFWIT